MFMPSGRRFLFPHLLGILAVIVLLAFAGPALAQEETRSEGGGTGLIEFLFLSVVGIILLLIYFIFVALLVWLLIDLRGAAMMPPDFIEAFEDAMNKRRYKDAFEMAKADHSMIGKVMTAGMARLQHGLQEARDAAEAMIESLRARKDHIIGYIAIIGTLGPLIGLVGTVSGMIESFAELGRGGTPDPSRLAAGISHALNATLVGIFLSCLAIPAYSFFKNRLSRIAIDASLMADDLLTQMYHSSRRPASEPPPSKTPASAPGVPAKQEG
jgi:biopolymer transport protein ExbB